MKKVLGLSIAVVLIIGLVSGGTWAFFSDTEISPSPPSEVYACGVVDFEQGLREDGSAVPPERSNPNTALGAPDGVFFSLGFGGWIELEFCEDICGEITIWEITGGQYPEETVTVEVTGSLDGENWTYLGEADNQTGMPGNSSHPTVLDLGEAHVRYVRITDVSNPDPVPDWPDDADAFDLDAITAWTCGSHMFRAGIIDLELEQDGSIVVDGEIPDLKPCQTGYLVITLTATENSNPMAVWKHILDITDANRAENSITDAEQDYYDNFLGGTPKNDIDRYIHFDLWIEKGGDPLEYNPGAGDIMLIPESEGWLLSDNPNTAETALFSPGVVDPTDNGVSCYWIYLGVLQPGESMVIVQSFHMDGTVDNWAQSDCLTFAEEFFAQQTVSSPPPPGIELPGHGRP